MIGLVREASASRTDEELADALGQTQTYTVGEIAAAWRECDSLVVFLPVGVTVRLLAPLLDAEATDPDVVCVDGARRFVVALLGAAVEDLAQEVADLLGAEPVVTDTPVRIAGLDTWSWPVEGDVDAVGRALAEGSPVRLDMPLAWPIPPLPTTDEGALTLAVTDRITDADVVVRPPSLVLGVGCSSGVSVEELDELISTTLEQQALSARSVSFVATLDTRANEHGILDMCARTGWSLVTHTAESLAQVDVPHPSPHQVAEAAAMLHGDLVVAKTKTAMATLAVSRIRPRGRLSLVGLGPGARDLLTPRAAEALRASSVWVGAEDDVEQVRDLARPGTRFLEGVNAAVAEATRGHAVALVGSDAAAALAIAGEGIDVDVVPGVSAVAASAALLGAPLGPDHASISLGAGFEQRVREAADLVVTLSDLHAQLPRALALLAENRPPSTPVGVVTRASREGQTVHLTTLGDVDPSLVDSDALVTVGSAQSLVVSGRFVTPKGP